MFSKQFLASLVCGSLLTLQAMADIPPHPGSLKTISVEFAPALSEVLIQSTAFQSSEDVHLARDGAWGPCTVKKSTWKQNNEKTMTCMSATSCFYKSKPACTVTFTSHRDESAESLLKIVK